MHVVPDARRLNRARQAKSLLAAELKEVRGVQGLGVGLNTASDDYAVHVYVRDRRAAKLIPADKDGVEVKVDFVGRVKAL